MRLSKDGEPVDDDGETVELCRFRDMVRELIYGHLTPLVADAEEDRRFPRRSVEVLGESGVFSQRWDGKAHGDLDRSLALAEEMGRAGLGGIGVGVSLHLEAATSLLVRFSRSPRTVMARDEALAGNSVGCVATSEKNVGSDLSAVETHLTPEDKGWRIRGTKWFVSPGVADFAIVLCSSERGPALAVVPSEDIRVVKKLATSGLRSLETARVAFDTTLPDEAILVRPGMGLQALTWGLMHERLAIGAQVLGSLDLALTLAVTHAQRRMQFGSALFRHQALRLRLADLHAHVRLARRGLYATAEAAQFSGDFDLREVAGAKATIARLGERVVSECTHVLGGTGYLEDETPLARLCRDLRIGRLGAGSDEMMWEIVADGLKSNEEVYKKWVED